MGRLVRQALEMVHFLVYGILIGASTRQANIQQSSPSLHHCEDRRDAQARTNLHRSMVSPLLLQLHRQTHSPDSEGQLRQRQSLSRSYSLLYQHRLAEILNMILNMMKIRGLCTDLLRPLYLHGHVMVILYIFQGGESFRDQLR